MLLTPDSSHPLKQNKTEKSGEKQKMVYGPRYIGASMFFLKKILTCESNDLDSVLQNDCVFVHAHVCIIMTHCVLNDDFFIYIMLYILYKIYIYNTQKIVIAL